MLSTYRLGTEGKEVLRGTVEGYLSLIDEGRGGEGTGFFAFFVGSRITLEFFSPFVSYKRHELHCI